MNKDKKQAYVVFAIFIGLPLLIFIIRDLYIKNKTKNEGIEVIAKYDSVQRLPKRSYYYFSYYLKGKKISTCNSGLKKLFEPNRITVIPNKFYWAKFNPKHPEVIIVNQDKEVTDTTLILQAGFSQKDIEKMLTED
jgi:hypothetical protein